MTDESHYPYWRMIFQGILRHMIVMMMRIFMTITAITGAENTKSGACELGTRWKIFN